VRHSKKIPPFKYVLKGKIEYVGMVRGKDCSIYLRFINKLRELDPTLAPKSTHPRDLLLERYEQLRILPDHQQRGFLLQDLLKDAFEYYGITVKGSFKRNEGSEQIDAAFELNGWHYILKNDG
jgi:hypothetical protein